MSTVASPKKSRNVERFFRLVKPFEPDGTGAEITIRMVSGAKVKKEETFSYWIDQVPADWGRAFLMEKMGDGKAPNEQYHVLIDTTVPDGSQDTCECQGFLRWGLGKDGRGCKHIGVCRKLIELGTL